MRFIITFLFIGAYHFLAGQNKISGEIKDGIYGDPVPFCIIEINDSINVLSDGLGHFALPSKPKIERLIFKAPFHKPLEYSVNSDSLVLDIRMVAFTIFLPLKKSDEKALNIIKYWQSGKSRKNYKTVENIQFKRNSVDLLKSNDIRRFKRNFNSYLSIFGKGLNHFPHDHYLIYNQSNELIEFKNKFSLEERIQSSKSIGVENPVEFTGGKALYDFSIYNDHWRIGAINYTNPLAGECQKRYLFKITDTVSINDTVLILIQFSPKIKKEANKLRGFIYYDIKNNEVRALWAEKAVDTDSKLRICAEYQSFEGLNVLKSTSLIQNLSGVQSYSTQIKLQSTENFSEYKFNPAISNTKYDEIIKEYSKNSNFANNGSFNESDSLVSNTEEFYKVNPQLQSLYRGLTFGKELYRGKIPLGDFEINTYQVLGFNNHEGLRLGIGMNTKESFSERYKSSAFLAYGFRDDRLKFGASERIFLDQKYWNWIEIFGRNDVFESGSSSFGQQENPMFRSEMLRRFGISVMDNEIAIGAESNLKLSKYLQSRLGLTWSNLDPTYDYAYKSDTNSTYNYADLSLGFRFSFGEERVRNGRDLIIKSNPFPVLFFKWNRGLSNLGSDFDYNKFEFRLNYQKQILGFGKSSLQINTGFIDRSVPYHKSFVARGGLRNFSVVFHNSFETMAYNEFLSDRYFYLFYSHNFGPLFFSFLNHFPSLEMQHNFGIGDLKRPEDHELIGFNIMNRGYLESGLFMNDIILINSAGLKTGLGTGVFYRYGAYQNPDFIKNLVIKISLNLDL